MPRVQVHTKGIYDPPDSSDGYRVLATRYWPRGVPSTAADEYVRAVSPSEETLRAFKDNRTDWWGFRKRYLEEMRSAEAQAEIHRLAKLASSRPVTLMCVCRDEARCHRSLLRELITQKVDEQRGQHVDAF